MTRKSRLSFIEYCLKYWQPIAGMTTLLIGGIVFLATLAPRVSAIEQDLDDLKGWAKEIQGYTRAMQQSVPSRQLEWQDPETKVWWCCDPQRGSCEDDDRGWTRCE